MFKDIRHFILIAALLLSILGNVARLGVCPCGGNFLGFFIGDCHCNICSTSTSTAGTECHDCLHSASPHAYTPGAADLADSGDSHKASFPSCPNKLLEGTGPLLQLPEISLPKVPLVVIAMTEWQEGPPLVLSSFSRESRFEVPPPPLLELGNSLYTGYMRPARA